MKHENSQKAYLALMRRGIGYTPGEIPELWGMLLEGVPEEMIGNGRNPPSREEWAIYTAMTLFAMHQQGHDLKKECMCVEKEYFGSAIAKLIHSEEDKERILRRFNSMATASDMPELIYHMRSIIQLLKAENIALDYPALARDIYYYQFPELRSNVRLSWGRKFYQTLYSKSNMDKSNNDEIQKV